MLGWNTNVGAPPSAGSTRQQHSQGPLQWLPTGLSRPPLPNTLPPLSALRPTGAYNPAAASSAQHAPVVVQTPVSLDCSSNGSRAIRDQVVTDDAAVDLDPEPAYDHPAPGPEPSSDGEMDVPLSRSQRGSDGALSREMDASSVESDSVRKHGKRLTTREETALFEICNRHAASFGERNRLCQWWVTVTQEFIAAHGHPYSWHSVRRKVEFVTQQRIKFLAGLDGKRGADLADSTWSAAVDSWIPSWQRFQDQEAERIRAKQGKRGRKRKSTAAELDSGSTTTSYPSIQLPSGFDTMFSPPARQSVVQPPKFSAAPTPSPAPVSLPTSTPSFVPTPTPSPATVAATPAMATSSPPMDQNVSAAILETLSMLNRNIEAVSPRNHQPSPTSSSQFLGTSNNSQSGSSSSSMNSIPTSAIKQIKSELRVELRQEMEKHRSQLEERLDTVQRTQQAILELLRQGPQ